MKNVAHERDEIPPEIDFSGGVRGRFVERVAAGSSLVVIEPELSRVFPSSEAVNQALRVIVEASKTLISTKIASDEGTKAPSEAVKVRGRRKAG